MRSRRIFARRIHVVILATLTALLASSITAVAHAIPPCNRPNPPPICDPDREEHMPIGNLDEVTSTTGGLRVRGWAIDPDTTRSITVRLLVDRQSRMEITANLDRPDVGAAHPGYGNAHGFDITVKPPRRHTSVCAIGVNVGQGSSKQISCRREPRSVSVLTLNVTGVHENKWTNDDGIGETYIPWRDRYRRVARWMYATGTLPDFIALQEMPAWKWYKFPGLHYDPWPYESLDVLIQDIKLRMGANYRIAYHSAVKTREGGDWQPLFQGRAMIYNADRVRNTTAVVATGPTVIWSDTTTTGGHLRYSISCLDMPRPGMCTLLDGNGQHWVAAHINTNTGRWEPGAAAAAFEFIAEPGKHIVVHNVHQNFADVPPKPGQDPDDAPALRALVDLTWAALLPYPKIWPPIIAGDFNGEPELLPDFDQFGQINLGLIDKVLTGKPEAFPSTHAPMEGEFEVTPPAGPRPEHCGTIETLLSDHCAVFAQYFRKG